MGIKQDRSGLPRGGNRKPTGRQPDAHARFAPIVATKWQEQYIASGQDFKPMAFTDARWRHSWAADCARKIHYRLREAIAIAEVGAELERHWYPEMTMDPSESHIDVDPGTLPWLRLHELLATMLAVKAEYEPTEPMGVADHWRFGIGQAVHDMLQDAVKAAFPDAEAEVTVRSSDLGAGHIDLVVNLPREAIASSDRENDQPYVIAIEIKTINGFGFKRMIGDRGNPEGPRLSSIVQLALNASAVRADEAVLIVLSAENLSPAVLKSMLARLEVEPGADEEWRRFCAEYTYTKDEFEPIAQSERNRMARIIELTDEGMLVPRSIPDPAIPPKARITDPAKGMWELRGENDELLQAGSSWHCDYCENRARCIRDGAS